MYYLRTRAAADAIKFTVDQESLLVNQKKQEAPAAAVMMSPSRSQAGAAAAAQQMLSPARKAMGAMSLVGADGMTHEEREAQLARMVCSLENKDACLMCGS
jgi:ribonucleoside-diphosphate reductase subunit M1